MNKLYERFHKKTSVQKSVIKIDNFTYRLQLPVIAKYLRSNHKVLDIGCGAGTLCLYYANKGNDVTGIDISEKAISNAQRSASILGLKNIKFKVVNFPTNVPSGKYDFIIFTEVIEHLKEDKLAISKIHALLNKNGILFLSTPSRNAPLNRLGLTKKFDKEVGHLRRYSEKDLINMCEDAGFRVIETKKTEGILRNFLFLNPIAGKLVRFIKYQISDLVTKLDNLSLDMFGESNIIVIAKKI